MLLTIRLVFIYIFIVSLTGSTTAFGQSQKNSGPYLTDIIVTTSDTHLLLFGELRNSLTEEMVAGLHSGIPVSFSFFVELEKNEPNWIDEELVSIEFEHQLSYDTLKEHYVIETEETSRKTMTTSSLEEATKILNEINGLKILELSRLQPEGIYRLRVKADLYKKTLPLRLHNIIPFISWWDLKTDWYTVEFTY